MAQTELTPSLAFYSPHPQHIQLQGGLAMASPGDPGPKKTRSQLNVWMLGRVGWLCLSPLSSWTRMSSAGCRDAAFHKFQQGQDDPPPRMLGMLMYFNGCLRNSTVPASPQKITN